MFCALRKNREIVVECNRWSLMRRDVSEGDICRQRMVKLTNKTQRWRKNLRKTAEVNFTLRAIDEEEVYKEVNVAMVTCQGGGVVGLGLNLVY